MPDPVYIGYSGVEGGSEMRGQVDTLLVGGRLFSAGMRRPRPGAVAIQGERIVAVGDEVRDLAAPGVEIVDVGGCLVLPGFQDAHVHPVHAGVDMFRCELHEAASAAECLELIAAYARTHPDKEWILGGGWSIVGRRVVFKGR